MGETNRHYHVMQAALCVSSELPNGEHERKQEGDIIGIRKPLNHIGFKEMHEYLWILLDGEEESVMDLLMTGLQEDDLSEKPFDKRRYCIPLQRLKEIVPTLDLAKVRDRTECYQPFMPVDEETGQLLYTIPPFSVYGLVWDKKFMRYV